MQKSNALEFIIHETEIKTSNNLLNFKWIWFIWTIFFPVTHSNSALEFPIFKKYGLNIEASFRHKPNNAKNIAHGIPMLKWYISNIYDSNWLEQLLKSAVEMHLTLYDA